VRWACVALWEEDEAFLDLALEIKSKPIDRCVVEHACWSSHGQPRTSSSDLISPVYWHPGL
jgi:hypothetical protein